MQRALVGRSGVQGLARAGVAVAMIASMLAVAGSSIASGQEAADCEVTDLGTLGSSPGSVLEAEGRWTTEDCDSRFRAGSGRPHVPLRSRRGGTGQDRPLVRGS